MRRTKLKIWMTAAIVIAASAGVTAGELVLGGGFETGSFDAAWTHGASSLGGNQNPSWADHAVVADLPYTGIWSALLGYKYTAVGKDRYGFMYQDVAIPASGSSASLFFRYRMQGFDGRGNDPFRMTVRDLSGTVLATVVDYMFNDGGTQYKDSGWRTVQYDMSAFAGQIVRLEFRQYNLNDNRYATWVFIDDVSLISSAWVDLAVDGEGDDLFGAPGTGAGGTSISSGVAGETVSYLLDIENESLDVDSYTVSVSPPAGWTAVIRYGGIDYSAPWVTPPVAGQSTITAEIIITIPAGEAEGSYATIVDAVSTIDSGRFDSVTLGMNIVPSDFDVDLVINGDGAGVVDPSGGGGSAVDSLYPGGSVDYAIEVFNTGSQPDSFDVWFDPGTTLSAVMIDGGTTYTGAFTTGVVAPGASAGYVFRVSAPGDVTGGDYPGHVYARSRSDNLKVDGVTGTTTVRAPRLDLVIDGSGDGLYDPTGSGGGGSGTVSGAAGDAVQIPVVVQNESSLPDAFTIDWTRPANGWSAVVNDGAADHTLPWTTPTLAPGEQRQYFLVITSPKNAKNDAYVSILDAVSTSDNEVAESVTAIVVIGDANEVDLIIDGDGDDVYGGLGTGLGGFSSYSVDPGDTVTFTIVVQNESGGNGFDFEWTSPAGWSVLLNGQPSPSSGGAGTYTLQAIVPLLSPGGVNDVVFDARKSNKPYFFDSVTGRIIVSSPGRVDALIDGNGDDVIGTTGAGDGGSSMQTAPAGSTFVFSVELQNQGPAAESYIIDWNVIAGWTATFDAQAAPCTTAAIAAGASAVYAFEAVSPAGALPGDYDFIIDVFSTVDPLNTESITARATVLPAGSGMLALVKTVDMLQAHPGEEMTYTITFSNAGTEDVLEIEIVDPIATELDLVTDAFGPGADIAWNTTAGTTYLTADPLDADEALFDTGTSTLRVILSRQAPFTLGAGESGSIEYRVRIR